MKLISALILILVIFICRSSATRTESSVCPDGYCQNWGICKEDDEGQAYCDCYAFFDYPEGERCQHHVIEPAGLAGRLFFIIFNAFLQGIVAVVGIALIVRIYRLEKLRLDIPNIYVCALTISSIGFCVLYAINYGNIWSLYPPWAQFLLYIPFYMIDLAGQGVFLFFWMYLILNFFRKQSLAEMSRSSSLQYVLKTWILPCVILAWCIGIPMLLNIWAMAEGLTVQTVSLGSVIYGLVIQAVLYPGILIWCRIKVNQISNTMSPEAASIFEEKFGWVVPYYLVFLFLATIFTIMNVAGLSTMTPGWGYIGYRTAENLYVCLFRAFLMWGLHYGTGKRATKIRDFLSFGTNRLGSSFSFRSSKSQRSVVRSMDSSPSPDLPSIAIGVSANTNTAAQSHREEA